MLDGFRLPGKATDLRFHAGGIDDPGGITLGNGQPHEDDVFLLRQRHLLVMNHFGEFLLGQRFTGQDKVVSAETAGPDEPHISGYRTAFTQVDDVSRHQVSLAHFHPAAVADDDSRRLDDLFQGLENALGLVLLVEADQCIDEYDNKQDGACPEIIQIKGKQRGNDQDDDQQVIELL